MKLKTNKISILKAMQTAAKATSKIMPLYENLLLTVSEGKAAIYGTDAQSGGVSIAFAVESKDYFSCLLPQSLINVISKCGDIITLSVKADKLTLISGKYRYSCVMEDCEGFQPMPTTDNYNTYTGLSQAIADCLPFVSTNEIKQAMTGIYINFEECEAVATDAHRLMLSKFEEFEAVDKPQNVTIRSNSAKLMQGCDMFAFTDNKAFFQCDNLAVWSSLIDESFPNYAAVIPKNNQIVGNIPSGLIDAVVRVSSASNLATNLVRFEIHENKVILSAQNIDFDSEASEDIEAEFSEKLTIGFSGKFLSEMLKEMPGAQMALSDPTKPCVFSCEGKKAILMPVMLADY